MTSRTKTILIFAALVLAFFIIAALFPLKVRSQERSNQIVLEYDSSFRDYRIFRSKTQIALGLKPLNNAAPLSPSTLSICRMAVVPVGVRTLDGKDLGPINEIVFNCGSDRYIFTTLVMVGDK